MLCHRKYISLTLGYTAIFRCLNGAMAIKMRHAISQPSDSSGSFYSKICTKLEATNPLIRERPSIQVQVW